MLSYTCFYNEMKITQGNVPIALDILREAAAWLIETGKPLWRLEDLTEPKILAGITEENVYIGWVDEEPAVTLILQWNDPIFWPQALNDSGFLHKLAVRRRFGGTDVARQMVAWAIGETQHRGRNYLRLDCAADRPKLCAFYENLGFRRVDRRMVGPYDMAFYELHFV